MNLTRFGGLLLLCSLGMVLLSISTSGDDATSLMEEANRLEKMGMPMDQPITLLAEADAREREGDILEASALRSRAGVLIQQTQEVHEGLGKERRVLASLRQEDLEPEEAAGLLSSASAEYLLGDVKSASSLLDDLRDLTTQTIRERYGRLVQQFKELSITYPDIPPVLHDLQIQNVEDALAKSDIARITVLEKEQEEIMSIMMQRREALDLVDAVIISDSRAIDDLDSEMLFELSMKRLGEAMTMADLLLTMSKHAAEAQKTISVLQTPVDTYEEEGMKVDEERIALTEIRNLFQKGDYEFTNEKAEQTLQDLEGRRQEQLILLTIEEPGASSLRDSWAMFWPWLALVMTTLLILTIILAPPFRRRNDLRRIQNYKKEETGLIDGIKGIQREYFHDHAISREEYLQHFDRYQERLAVIHERIPTLEQRSVNACHEEQS